MKKSLNAWKPRKLYDLEHKKYYQRQFYYAFKDSIKALMRRDKMGFQNEIKIMHDILEVLRSGK